MKRYRYFILALVVIALDQATKIIADRLVDPYEPVDVFPFFRLVNVENLGAAFGMFKAMGNVFFMGVAAVAVVFIVYLLLKEIEDPFGLALVLGGALGNLIDRLVLGHVRDFLDVYAGTYHWPAFNVADSALTVGIAIVVLSPFLKRKKGREAPA